jgi:CrcB protein
MSALDWVVVAVCGGGGAIARFLLDEAVERYVATEFPFGTFVVNGSGTFVLGLLTGAGVSGHALLFAGTATIGAFTTFSTWMLETERLAEDGENRFALANVGLTLAVGFALALALAGWAVGRVL